MKIKINIHVYLRRLSTRKIVNVWNENQRGECELSKMNIVKRKLSHSRWNEQDIVGIVKNNCV